MVGNIKVLPEDDTSSEDCLDDNGVPVPLDDPNYDTLCSSDSTGGSDDGGTSDGGTTDGGTTMVVETMVVQMKVVNIME